MDANQQYKNLAKLTNSHLTTQPSAASSAPSTCAGCAAPLLPGDRTVSAGAERRFHAGCLRCEDCGEQLGGEGGRFFLRGDGKLVCKNHMKTVRR